MKVTRCGRVTTSTSKTEFLKTTPMLEPVDQSNTPRLRSAWIRFGAIAIFAVALVAAFFHLRQSVLLPSVATLEANQRLTELANAQRALHDEYGIYSSDFNELKYAPVLKSTNRYLVGMIRSCTDPTTMNFYFPPASDQIDLFHLRTVAERYFSGKCNDFEEGFTAFAIGNLDADDNLDLWTVSEDRKLQHLLRDLDSDLPN